MYRTSAKARRQLAEHILDPDEFEISDTYTSRVAEIFAVILKSLGLRIEFVDEDDILEEYDDSVLKEFELDGIGYLCTEFQFMLIQRKKEIEKELLKKYGIIDADELEKLVMAEMMARNFVVGPDKEDYEKMPAFLPDTVE